MSATEPDLIRHSDVIAAASTPEDSTATSEGDGDWQVRVGGGVDIDDPTSVGPAQLEAWSRFVGAPDDPGVNQGLLAFATEGMLIATAMRPHEGVAQSLAHRTRSEEHTYELQSLMRNSYHVFCLKKKKQHNTLP